MNQTALSQFHPLVAKWFTDTVGEPTDAQTQAWPKIADGEHVLITAPTGSGKTLTAFLWAINQLVIEELPIGHTSVLYVSPAESAQQRHPPKPPGAATGIEAGLRRCGTPLSQYPGSDP